MTRAQEGVAQLETMAIHQSTAVENGGYSVKKWPSVGNTGKASHTVSNACIVIRIYLKKWSSSSAEKFAGCIA